MHVSINSSPGNGDRYFGSGLVEGQVPGTDWVLSLQVLRPIGRRRETAAGDTQFASLRQRTAREYDDSAQGPDRHPGELCPSTV